MKNTAYFTCWFYLVQISVFVSLIFASTLTFAQDASELLLKNSDGEMLSQVSGLSQVNDLIVFLVQDEDRLYFAKKKRVVDSFANPPHELLLKSTVLSGRLPEIPSWEAVAFGTRDGKLTIFLAHEHAGRRGSNDEHRIYYGEVGLSDEGLSVGPLTPFGDTLPLLSDARVKKSKKSNYGYEAIAWVEEAKALLVVPELHTTGQATYLIDGYGKSRPVMFPNHGLRISDMAHFSGSTSGCFIATSFCHETDKICSRRDGKSALSLAVLEFKGNQMQLLQAYDRTNDLLQVGKENRPNKEEGQFNAEGIVVIDEGLLIVNDNDPKGKARTALRLKPTAALVPTSCSAEMVESEDAYYYDFWPGTWVEVVNGRVDTSATTFTVRRSVHPAAFEEDWRQVYDGGSFRSKALRAWDRVANRWMFTRVSENALFEVWEGEKIGDHWYIIKEFEIDGATIVSRQAWIPEAENRLIRIKEESTNGGQTWTTKFRMTFERVSR